MSNLPDYHFSALAGFVLLPGDTPVDQLPSDAVPVTAARYAAIQAELAQGRTITMDDDGQPMTEPPLVVTAEQLDAEARSRRDNLLRSTDWIVTRAVERGESVPAVVVAYRQALRDITEQPGYPGVILWPQAPKDNDDA